MRKDATTKEDSSTGVVPSAPWRVNTVRPLESYRLYVQFLDGLEGFVDLSKLITSENAGVFRVLRDTQLFNQVYLDHGAVTWPGELDLAPDAMHDVIKEKGEWVL